MKYITGSASAGEASAGANTLRYRQSSDPTSPSPSSSTNGWARLRSCTLALPLWSAASSPCHGCGGRGAFQRSGPTGGAAYGIPRQTRAPLSATLPRSVPCAIVSTVSSESSAVMVHLTESVRLDLRRDGFRDRHVRPPLRPADIRDR